MTELNIGLDNELKRHDVIHFAKCIDGSGFSPFPLESLTETYSRS